jgi:hypothetical protein
VAGPRRPRCPAGGPRSHQRRRGRPRPRAWPPRGPQPAVAARGRRRGRGPASRAARGSRPAAPPAAPTSRAEGGGPSHDACTLCKTFALPVTRLIFRLCPAATHCDSARPGVACDIFEVFWTALPDKIGVSNSSFQKRGPVISKRIARQNDGEGPRSARLQQRRRLRAPAEAGERAEPGPAKPLGFGRIVGSEIEVLNMFVNLP